MSRNVWCVVVLLVVVLGTVGCGRSSGAGKGDGGVPGVLADTTFLADIAQNVAGERREVVAIVPLGADPHSFEPTPQDAKRIAQSPAVIINVAGLVPQLDDLIAAVGGDDLVVIEAAAGLPGISEDPHAWLDPVLVTDYARNIAEGLASLDGDGAAGYRSRAEDYSRVLRELDAWIAARVESIPAERRLLVTNHESFGYFAARYGFKIVGTVFPTVAGEGSPSAQQVAALIGEIRTTGAPAIFLETGSNADLARQIARETGMEVVTDLYVASLGENASSYVDMMRWNVGLIVEALR
jgi:ABC-type Zn uptake system ZnuABC Zn-binding protein ZnuA